MLGYWPEDSLVAITMQGKVLGATLRVDLPNLDSPQARSGFADQIRNFLIADEDANGVVLALYTDSGWEDGDVVRQAIPLLEALQWSLDEVDLSVRDAWLVGSEYWRSAYCTDLQCCPVPGLPVDRIKNSRLSAELVYRGGAPSGRRRGAGPDSPGFQVRGGRWTLWCWQQRHATGSRFSVGGGASGVWTPSLLCGTTCLRDAKRMTHCSPGVDAEILGFLRTTLRVPAWRDAVVVMAAAGMESAKSGAAAFGLFIEDDAGTPFDPQELGVPAPSVPAAKVHHEPDTSGGRLHLRRCPTGHATAHALLEHP